MHQQEPIRRDTWYLSVPKLHRLHLFANNCIFGIGSHDIAHGSIGSKFKMRDRSKIRRDAGLQLETKTMVDRESPVAIQMSKSDRRRLFVCVRVYWKDCCNDLGQFIDGLYTIGLGGGGSGNWIDLFYDSICCHSRYMETDRRKRVSPSSGVVTVRSTRVQYSTVRYSTISSQREADF